MSWFFFSQTFPFFHSLTFLTARMCFSFLSRRNCQKCRKMLFIAGKRKINVCTRFVCLPLKSHSMFCDSIKLVNDKKNTRQRAFRGTLKWCRFRVNTQQYDRVLRPYRMKYALRLSCIYLCRRCRRCIIIIITIIAYCRKVVTNI